MARFSRLFVIFVLLFNSHLFWAELIQFSVVKYLVTMASSASSGSGRMIVQYDWILENVDEEPKKIASKMILFRGERVFRVGLKNHRGGDEPPVLFFMAVDLIKMGMKVKEVTYGIRDGDNDIDGPAKMIEMVQENVADVSDQRNSSVNCGVQHQLFTIELANQVIGNCKFMFRICIKGSYSGYSYRLSDRLVKRQIWDAVIKNKNGADVEIVVKGKTFSAHKAILAARSPVFAAEFARFFSASLKISDVEPSTVEQFLYFIYTGESKGTFANEELLKLADEYQLKTLTGLCQVALAKIKPIQMVNLDRILNKKSEILTSSIIRPHNETEIFFDLKTHSFRCDWTFHLKSNDVPSKCMMKYQNEDIFFAYITGKVEEHGENSRLDYVSHPRFDFVCAKHGSCGLKVEDIYLSGVLKGNWFKMELTNFQENEHLLHFISHSNVYSNDSAQVSFDVNVMSTIDNYYYEMMDGAWMYDFWTAATNKKFTDVEIFVGTDKLMEAHRIILSARSLVLNEALKKVENRKTSMSMTLFGVHLYTVKFDAKFNVDIVKNFLKFLYTGSLESSAKSKQLLELATQYKVETLKNICQLADHDPDVEEFTNSLLQLAIQQD